MVTIMKFWNGMHYYFSFCAFSLQCCIFLFTFGLCRNDLEVPSSPYIPTYAQGEQGGPPPMLLGRFQNVLSQLFQYVRIRHWFHHNWFCWSVIGSYCYWNFSWLLHHWISEDYPLRRTSWGWYGKHYCGTTPLSWCCGSKQGKCLGLHVYMMY